MYFHLIDSSFLISEVSQESSCPFSRQELVSMVATLRDACLGIVYLAIPDSKPVFDDKRQFLEELGIKTNKEKLMSKEEYMKQRSQWIYLFNVSVNTV
jgi:ubiquitin-protein ligase E3 C